MDASTRPLTVVVDVTDTVATEWRAGIQRVVCRVVDELGRDDRLEVVPVVWLESARAFRRLTAEERARLAPDAPPPAEPRAPGEPAPVEPAAVEPAAVETTRVETARAGSVPEPAATATSVGARARLVDVVARTGLESAARRVRRRIHAATRDRHLVPLVFQPPAGSVLLELDTVWNNLWIERADLLASLRASGVHVATLVYDLLPQRHPEWFESTLVAVSDSTLRAQLAAAELVFAISEHTAADVADWAAGQQLVPPPAVVVTLGAALPEPPDPAALPAELDGVHYALTVGTVEPRKNHTVLLDAFDRWRAAGSDLQLVIVGRPGWHNDDVIARIDSHPERGRSLHWWRRCDDATLAELYRSATVVAVPSITEGFGLPVVEALSYGVPVVASNGGALPEAADGRADLLAPHDVDAWVDAIVAHDDPAHHRRVSDAVGGYRPPSWDDTGRTIADALVASFT